jgi:hypothetical protein
MTDVQMPGSCIAEQAERAGRVIRSVHDFVRRRDQARKPVQAQALLDAIMPLVNLQARKSAGAGGNPPAGRPAAGALRPHHGRAGAAEPDAQCHAGHGQCRHWPTRVAIQIRGCGRVS